MSDVAVIGTGAMGSALVEALAGSGADVTEWNRTKAKAEALSGPRVCLAGSVAEAPYRRSQVGHAMDRRAPSWLACRRWAGRALSARFPSRLSSVASWLRPRG